MAKNDDVNTTQTPGSNAEQPVQESSGTSVGSETSTQRDNSSMKRAGSNESARSKGDKETKEVREQEEKEEREEQKQAEKAGKEAAGEGVKKGISESMAMAAQRLKEMLQMYLEMLKKVPAAIMATAVAIIVGIVAAILSVLGSLVPSVTPTLTSAPDYAISYIKFCFTGDTDNAEALDENAAAREMARRIWSVMSAFEKISDPGGSRYQDAAGNDAGPVQKTYGLRPEQVFAMLGNFEHESGLDPTAVESIFDEAWQIGTVKQRAISKDFIVDMWKTYPDASTTSARYTYFSSHPTIYKAGIGLAQWTDVLSAGATYDISNPGRNTKLCMYAALYGMEWYIHQSDDDAVNGTSPTDRNNDGWNAEEWIAGNVETEGLWYDPRIQLAYILDKSDVGDTMATWVWDWANDASGSGDEAGETDEFIYTSDGTGSDDFAVWMGDENVDLNSSTMLDSVLEGWKDSFSSDDGWHAFEVVDDIVSFNNSAHAVGDNTNDINNFRGNDSNLSGQDLRDEYYSNTNNTYVAEVAYDDFEAGNALVTDLDYTAGSTIGNVDGTYGREFAGSDEDSSRKVAAWWANNSANAVWHGDKTEVDGSVTTGVLGSSPTWNSTSIAAGHDYICEIDPNLYHFDDYAGLYFETGEDNDFQIWVTADEAKALDEYGTYPAGATGEIDISSVVNLRTGSVWDSSAATEHTHSSSCYTYYPDSNPDDDVDDSHTDLTCGMSEHTHGSKGNYSGYGDVASHNTSTCGCKWHYTYKAGWLKKFKTYEGLRTTDPAKMANHLAKKQYINTYKYIYRYHLYRYQTLYYTSQFLAEYEGNPGNAIDSRYQNALKWFNMWWDTSAVSGKADPNKFAAEAATYTTAHGSSFNDHFFRAEEGYAQGIMLGIKRTQDELANDQKDIKFYKYDSEMAQGHSTQMVDNTLLAAAACQIAWPTKAASQLNDGIPAYQYIHDKVIPGDTIYQSCDRTVCTAVRWSGLDDNFPAGSTLQLAEYLASSPRWVEIDWGGNDAMLDPGDILIRKDALIPGSGYTIDGMATDSGAHHILMYVGNQMAEGFYNIWEDPTFVGTNCGSTINIVHGSFGERSPAYDTLYADLRSYHAYRCIDPMTYGKSKYSGYEYTP